MDEENYEYRNNYYEEDERNGARNAIEDFRNAPRRRVVTTTPWGTRVMTRPAPMPAPMPVIVQAPPPPPPPPQKSFLGEIPLGTLVQLGALGYTAIVELPAKPVITGDVKTDNQNLVLYQEALAKHAKRVQQINTAGLVASVLLAGKRL